MMSFLLYFLLGVLLYTAKVSVLEQPVLFFAILFCVLGIDMNSHFNALKEKK